MHPSARRRRAPLACAVAAAALAALPARAGQFATDASFTGTNGAGPYADLTDVGGMLYGTAVDGGSAGAGTVFSVTLPAAANVLEPGSLALLGARLTLTRGRPG